MLNKRKREEDETQLSVSKPSEDQISYWFDAAQKYNGKSSTLIRNVEINYTKAVNYYTLAASMGHIKSMIRLHKMYYLTTKGVKQNYGFAFYWILKAADKNNTFALNLVGEMYYNGNGIQQDNHKAFSYFKAACEQGSPAATCNLARCYHYGKGITKSLVEAKRLYNLALAQGHSSHFFLYDLYKNNGMKPENYARSLYHLAKAYQLGDSDANYLVNVQNILKMPPIVKNCMKGDLNNVNMLRNKAPLDSADKNNNTVLHWAVLSGSADG